MPKKTAFILLAGLFAGTLDALAAIIVYSPDNPGRIFQFIASGAMGTDAFAGGTSTVVAGVSFHYLIAMIWAIVLFIVYPRVGILSRNKYATGIAYGIFVWCVMNLVVLPLSKIGPRPLDVKGSLVGMLILVIAVGIPISFFATAYFERRAGR